jgi:hypothetical protein
MLRRLSALAFLVAVLTFGVAQANAAPKGEPQALAAAGLLVDPLVEEAQIDALSTSTSTSSGTEHFGPIPSSSPDSGTCGNDWAQDTFDRVFTIHDNRDGTFTVYEQFKNGTFVTATSPDPSPGACDMTDGYGPGTLPLMPAFGTMHGYLVITVIGTRNPAASCSDAGNPCGTTTGAITHLFLPGATFTIGTYFFHYAGYDGSNQALVVHEWKNASCDRGGNHGDIAGTSTGTIPPAPCV